MPHFAGCPRCCTGGRKSSSAVRRPISGPAAARLDAPGRKFIARAMRKPDKHHRPPAPGQAQQPPPPAGTQVPPWPPWPGQHQATSRRGPTRRTTLHPRTTTTRKIFFLLYFPHPPLACLPAPRATLRSMPLPNTNAPPPRLPLVCLLAPLRPCRHGAVVIPDLCSPRRLLIFVLLSPSSSSSSPSSSSSCLPGLSRLPAGSILSLFAPHSLSRHSALPTATHPAIRPFGAPRCLGPSLRVYPSSAFFVDTASWDLRPYARDLLDLDPLRTPRREESGSLAG